MPRPDAASERLREVESVGFDRLLAEHRAAWAARWADAEVAIHGDPDAELAVRFALFHLLASAAADGEAAVGARGLTGPVYAGHVFWDADVFVLPVLAAAQGRSGPRFAWESAADGTEVTPRWVTDRQGNRVRIRTGELEDYIVAEVAWAAYRYADWTREFLARNAPAAGTRLEVRNGWPPDRVLEVARAERADMIALGWGWRLGPDRAAVVREVLTRTPVPVILLPRPA